ncbi:alpha/beta hydrolase [Pseudonocardia sp. MH-G8]|uniref:alpha/beta hydrolase n=1 Tax=Pseudonocardia sp. MH-G8 TaxID=1854588 RepID=UPI000BA13E07|nr:alpha/beta fold hydrolase [Pseudonocardia sp. MH-G8]OZM81215.1 alpha/beta hydrolase [Pseudonocardia sp. MH-G8]
MPPSLPRLDPIPPRATDPPPGVALVLHGGRSRSTESGERSRLTRLRMLPFARGLSSAGAATYLLRYRYRGWNAPRKDPVQDARWALAEIAARHPGVPVVLVGHSMGARAALAAAGGPGVTAVCALAPWLDVSDPVDQLAGRTVLIAHGDRERYTDPRESYAYAVRAKRVTDRVARFDVHGTGHSMLARARDWHALVRRFVLGELGIEPADPLITNALRRPSPEGLSVALPRNGADR